MKRTIDTEAAADAIVALINAKASSPTRDQILQAMSAAEPTVPVVTGKRWEPTAEQKLCGQISRPLDAFSQVVGPPCAYNDMVGADGTTIQRCVYQAFGWKSADPSKIEARVRDLATQMKSLGCQTIVWRTNPEMAKRGDEYLFYCRFHILPYVQLSGFKPEAEEMAEA